MGTHFSVNTRSMMVKENVKKYVLYAVIIQFKCLINFSFKNKRIVTQYSFTNVFQIKNAIKLL